VQHLLRTLTFKTIGGAAGTRSVVFSVTDSDGVVSNEGIVKVRVA
jgi:hypothetical protein